MRTLDILRRSGRNLRQAKARTFLTAMAIAVGAFTLTMTLAASNGLRDYTNNLITSNFDPAELLVGRDEEVANTGAPKDQPQEFDETVTTLQQGGGGGSFQLKRVTREDVDELKKKPYAEQVRENYQVSIRYVTREGQKKYTGNVEAYNTAQKPEIKSGKLPARGDIPTGSILLPESYVSLLGFSSPEDALGKQVSIAVTRPFSNDSLQSLLSALQTGTSPEALTANSKPEEKLFTYIVSGVTKKSATSISIGTMPVRLSGEDAKQLYTFTTEGTQDYDKFLYVQMRVKDGEQASAIEAAKRDLTESGYYSIGSKELQKAITQFVDILTIMVGVFGLITVIASVFGIVNTQYISVLERTREIGLMKALGMSRRQINRLFMFEASWIGLLGGGIGVLIGLLVGNALNPVITKQLDLGEGNNLLIFEPTQMALLIFALILIATIAGLLPARRAAKLDPIEALRTE